MRYFQYHWLYSVLLRVIGGTVTWRGWGGIASNIPDIFGGFPAQWCARSTSRFTHPFMFHYPWPIHETSSELYGDLLQKKETKKSSFVSLCTLVCFRLILSIRDFRRQPRDAHITAWLVRHTVTLTTWKLSINQHVKNKTGPVHLFYRVCCQVIN